MALPEIIDCRPEAIANEIAPSDQKFALIFFNMEPEACGPDSSKLLKVIGSYFGKSDIKIWLDEHQLVILSCRDTEDFDLFAAVKKVECSITCKTGVVFYPEDGRSLNVLTKKIGRAHV